MTERGEELRQWVLEQVQGEENLMLTTNKPKRLVHEDLVWFGYDRGREDGFQAGLKFTAGLIAKIKAFDGTSDESIRAEVRALLLLLTQAKKGSPG